MKSEYKQAPLDVSIYNDDIQDVFAIEFEVGLVFNLLPAIFKNFYSGLYYFPKTITCAN